MSTEIRFTIFIVVIACIIGFILYTGLNDAKKNLMLADELKSQYQKALQDKNKQLALQLGRQYYTALRKTSIFGNGRLTIYDEQAITNDIASIS
jgi:hypothetical protein